MKKALTTVIMIAGILWAVPFCFAAISCFLLKEILGGLFAAIVGGIGLIPLYFFEIRKKPKAKAEIAVAPAGVEVKPEKKKRSKSLTVPKREIDPVLKMVIDEIKKGTSLQEIAQRVSEITGMDIDECFEQVETVSSYCHNGADVSGYRAAGIEEYEFMASLDDETCPICGALDGKHFKIKDAKIGVNFPPMHLGCRCTTTAYDPEDAADWAASGQPMPEYMTYAEWKAARPYEIIEESKEIIHKTTDIGTFFSRYELLLDQAQSLKDKSVFETHSQLYGSCLKGFVRRYYLDAMNLKTKRGRNARLERLCEAIQNAPVKYECMRQINASVVPALLELAEEKQKLELPSTDRPSAGI